MRVLFLRTTALDADSRVQKEMQALNEIGYSISAFGWDRSANGLIYEDILSFQQQFPIHKCRIKAPFGGSPLEMLFPFVRFQFTLAFYLLKHRKEYDIIHACDFDTAFTAGLIAKWFHKKFVYDIFDYYIDTFHVPEFSKPIIRLFDKHTIMNADLLILCTEERKKQIPCFHPSKTIIVQNTPDIRVTEDTDRTSTNTLMKIAYFGSFQESRLLPELLQIIQENPNYRLEIGGFGLLEPMVREASNCCNRIHFHGKLPYTEVITREKETDIMLAIYDPCVPNHRYAAPNKFYEAMALGKPLIVCQNTGIDKIITELHCGVVIAYQKEALSNALSYLYQHKEDWQKMNKVMKEYYKTNLTWPVSKIIR